MDEPFVPAPEAPPLPPQVELIEPRRTGRRRSPEPKKKSHKFTDGIKLVFDCHIPFTSHGRKKAKKPRKESRPDDLRGRPITPVYVPTQPEPQYPQPQIPPMPPMGGFPGPRMTPVPPPPPPPPPPRAPTGQTPPITVCSYSSTNSSPSPILPFRDHRRPRARFLPAHRTYEERRFARRREAEADALAEEQRRAAARRRRDEEQRRERIQEERDRLARQRRAHIPRGARHATVIHHHHHHHHHDRETNGFQRRAREDFEDDGDRVLNNAIRAEHFRPAGHGAPLGGQPRWPHAQGLRRRGTIAAGERRVYDDDLRRRGPRWL